MALARIDVEKTRGYKRHGIFLRDPYLNLEQRDKHTDSWTRQENRRAEKYFRDLSRFPEILKGVEKLNSGVMITEQEDAGYYTFYVLSDPKLPQPVIHVKTRMTGRDRVLINPNTMGEGIAIDWYSVSDHGEYVAYGISSGGSERSVLHVKRVSDGRKLSEQIPNAEFSSVAWYPGGFFYTRYIPDEVDGEKLYRHEVYQHRLGDHWQNDPLVFAPQDIGKELVWVGTYNSEEYKEESRYVLVVAFQDSQRSQIYLATKTEVGVSEFKPIFSEPNAMNIPYIWNDKLFVMTDDHAPLGKIVRTELLPDQQTDPLTWVEQLEEEKEKKRLLSEFGIAGQYLIANYLQHASGQIDVIDLVTGNGTSLSLPENITTLNLKWTLNQPWFTFDYHSCGIPNKSIKIEIGEDLEINEKIIFDRPIPEEYLPLLEQIETRQVFYTAEDGTSIPMFVAMREGTPLDGTRKLILEGYGGYGIPSGPIFRPSALWWFEQGYIYAIACVRGGGEYGTPWHKAGSGLNVSTSIDDFISAAKYLSMNNFTSPSLLGARGGSRGGLLVTGAGVKAPEWFGAIVAEAPFIDVTRTDLIDRAPQLQFGEYGNPNIPEEYKIMAAYSPYQNIKHGVHYPAWYTTDGENDPRCNPAHVKKFHARMKDSSRSGKDVLMHVDPDTGHGFGTPNEKQIRDAARVLAFFDDQLQNK